MRKTQVRGQGRRGGHSAGAAGPGHPGLGVWKILYCAGVQEGRHKPQGKPGAEVGGVAGPDPTSLGIWGPPPGAPNAQAGAGNRDSLNILSFLHRFLAQSEDPSLVLSWSPLHPKPTSRTKSPGISNAEAENREKARVLPPSLGAKSQVRTRNKGNRGSSPGSSTSLAVGSWACHP